MFTGIVEELAQVIKITHQKQGFQFTISAKIVFDDLMKGDSIAVNGVCLTVIKTYKNTFKLDLVKETLDRSNLGEIVVGNYVNLERALKVSDRFGGHIVQGHIEAIGVILDKHDTDSESILMVGLDPKWMKYCIPKGSITLDGVSLTISNIEDNIIKLSLIPHTLENTTLGKKEKSDTLNVETDIIGKYIDRLLSFDGEIEDIDAGILKAIKHIQYGES